MMAASHKGEIMLYLSDITVPKTVPGKLKTKILLGSLILGLCITNAVIAAPPPGVSTAPYTISYSAKLINAVGAAVTTAQSVRFSIWSDADSDPTDYLPGGTINPAAGGFTGWQETHNITPDANGLFHLQLGTINTLPNFTSSTHGFLEVDVKPDASPDIAYEVLDPDGNTANLTDRHPLNSGAYAINADTVDNHYTGTEAGNIPFLDPSGKLPVSTIPGGTNNDTFILDFDDTVVPPGKITLQFGSLLAKVLEYDTLAGWFNFNDNVNITGNLTVTGTINGVPLGPYNQSLVFEPQYGDAVIQPDGTDNKGTLRTGFTDTDGAPGNANYNYYSWTTNQLTMQDNDLVFRIKLPEGFTGFQATPIEFTYRTLDGILADNGVDLSIEDTTGTPVVLTGATGLVSTVFAVTPITFVGAPVFTAGQTMTVIIKLSALNTGAAYAGQLKINYIGK
jgi:hypothetical protein